MSNTETPWPERTPPRRHSTGRRVTPERRSRILDVAVDICVEDGFAAVTMQTVARRADYVRAVVYDCYGTPENIVLSMLDREAAGVVPGVAEAAKVLAEQTTSRDHLARVLVALLDHARADLKSWALFGVPTDGESAAVVQRVTQVRETVRTALASALHRATDGVDPPLDVEAVSYLAHGIVDAVIRRMLEAPDANPPERVERMVTLLAGTVRLSTPRAPEQVLDSSAP